jgi:hypothetical protein
MELPLLLNRICICCIEKGRSLCVCYTSQKLTKMIRMKLLVIELWKERGEGVFLGGIENLLICDMDYSDALYTP